MAELVHSAKDDWNFQSELDRAIVASNDYDSPKNELKTLLARLHNYSEVGQTSSAKLTDKKGRDKRCSVCFAPFDAKGVCTADSKHSVGVSKDKRGDKKANGEGPGSDQKLIVSDWAWVNKNLNNGKNPDNKNSINSSFKLIHLIDPFVNGKSSADHSNAIEPEQDEEQQNSTGQWMISSIGSKTAQEESSPEADAANDWVIVGVVDDSVHSSSIEIGVTDSPNKQDTNCKESNHDWKLDRDENKISDTATHYGGSSQDQDNSSDSLFHEHRIADIRTSDNLPQVVWGTKPSALLDDHFDWSYRRPMIYDQDEHTLHIGQPGAFHQDLYHEFGMKPGMYDNEGYWAIKDADAADEGEMGFFHHEPNPPWLKPLRRKLNAEHGIKDPADSGYDFEQANNWSFSKTDDRQITAAYQSDVPYDEHPGDPTVREFHGGEDDLTYGWRSPIIWEPKANRVRLGDPGAYHFDLHTDDMVHPYIEGWIAHPNPHNRSDFVDPYIEAPNHGLNIRDGQGIYPLADKEKVRQALIPFRPEAAHDADKNQGEWGFTSAQHQQHVLNWTPGNTGKGIVFDNGAVHSWNTTIDPLDANREDNLWTGFPHHGEYEHPDINDVVPRTFFYVHPDGYAESVGHASTKDINLAQSLINPSMGSQPNWNL